MKLTETQAAGEPEGARRVGSGEAQRNEMATGTLGLTSTGQAPKSCQGRIESSQAAAEASAAEAGKETVEAAGRKSPVKT